MTDNKNNQEELKDEKDLDSLFDDLKNSKLNRAVRKAKWHSILRNVVITFLVLGVVMIAGPIANQGIVDKMWVPAQIAMKSFNEISAPNQYIGKSSRYQGLLNGRTEYSTFKIIEGKVVYTGENEYSYGLFKDYYGNWIGTNSPLILGRSWDAEDLELQRYNELGQREMVFFYPFLDYPDYRNDLQSLDNIASAKIMEMALSFDKDYTLEEVNNMLPHNVTLSWYWLDDLNEQEKEASKPRVAEQQRSDGTTYTVDYQPRLRSERTAYGIKAYDSNGTSLEEPEQQFIWAFKNGMDYDTRFKYKFERVFQNVAGEDSEITKEDFRIFGVVVTGDAESLQNLRDLPFIRAASLGVITDKY
ncbi:MAG: anti sigma factor C-terminal domain-containing protein [Bacillota bacterium]|nr:anti sigma factor C-terminal domain-containing protein [Bacillota bacterium]